MIVVEGMGKRNPHQVASRQEPGKGLLCYIAKLALVILHNYITERKICDNLKKLHITQIIITHRLSQVEDADMIYVLNHGEIMEKGSHEQLMKGKGLYSKLVRIA